jgi:hypothetical protein
MHIAEVTCTRFHASFKCLHIIFKTFFTNHCHISSQNKIVNVSTMLLYICHNANFMNYAPSGSW